MRIFPTITALLFPLFAFGFKGMVTFTPEEKETHKASLNIVLAKAASCLSDALTRQQQFHRRYGIAAFYGSTSEFVKLTEEQRRMSLRELGVPASVLPELKSTSCVDYAASCLRAGFLEAKQDAIWAKLRSVLKANDGDGSALQEALRELGWRALYWNADVSQNKASDLAERELDPTNTGSFYGFHEFNWQKVKTKSRYYTNTIDDARSLVNFGSRPPKMLKKIPYFLGSSHMGYHIFSGVYGQVYEAHASRAITDPQTIEKAPFNPGNLGGGPNGAFRSGVLTVPPGF